MVKISHLIFVVLALNLLVMGALLVAQFPHDSADPWATIEAAQAQGAALQTGEVMAVPVQITNGQQALAVIRRSKVKNLASKELQDELSLVVYTLNPQGDRLKISSARRIEYDDQISNYNLENSQGREGADLNPEELAKRELK